MAQFTNKRPILASVAVGPYGNHGNRLIERSTLSVLGLPETTPRFSVFEPINDELLERINTYDYLLVTGCTTLQDSPGHQSCFDDQFCRIRIPKVCFAGTFYCEPDDKPSLRIARLYDQPIGTRDPWAAEYLTRHGLECEFIGCPTLLDGPDRDDWREGGFGDVLISSTPPLELSADDLPVGRALRYLSHDTVSSGEDLLAPDLFEGADLVITGRLHAALPAIARGVRVRFFDQRHWHADYRWQQYGSIRYTLLDHLQIPLDGRLATAYPAAQIKDLKRSCRSWVDRVIGMGTVPVTNV